MPRDITVTFADGSSHVYQNAPDNITPEQVTERATKEFGQPVTALDGGATPAPKAGAPEQSVMGKAWDWLKGGLKEDARIADTTVRGGLLAITGAIGDLGALAIEKGTQGLLHSKTPPVKFEMRPSQALETLTGGPINLPQTTVGKYLGSAGENAVAAAMPLGRGAVMAKALLRPAAVGAVSGLGAEAADQASGGNNPLARVAGGLAAGIPASLLAARTPNAIKVVRDALKGTTEADWANAKATEKTLIEAGIPHLKSGLVGKHSTLDDVVAAAGTHPDARPVLTKAMAGIDQAAKSAVDQWMLKNMATGVKGRRGTLADVQQSADDFLSSLQSQAREAYKEALPPGMEAEHYAPAYVQALQRELMNRANAPDVGLNSAMGQLLQKVSSQLDPVIIKVPDGVTTTLQPVTKQIGNKVVNRFNPVETPVTKDVAQPITKGQVNRVLMEMNALPEAEGVKAFAQNTSKQLLKDFTPEFQPARDAMRQTIENVVEPAQKSLVGDIAKVGGGVRPDKTTAGDQIFRIVFNPDRPQGPEITKLTKQIGPDNMGELLREHIVQTSNKIFKKGSETELMRQPFRFSQALTGSAAQRENINAAIKAVSPHYGVDGEAAAHGFNRLINALDTTHFMQLPSSVDRAALGQQLGESATSLLVAPNSRLGRWFTEGARTRSVKKIADIVTSPDGLSQLERIAKTKEPSAAAALAKSIVSDSINEDKAQQAAQPKP